MSIAQLKRRIDAADANEDYQAASAACLDYLEWHFREVLNVEGEAGTQHIINALRQIDREA